MIAIRMNTGMFRVELLCVVWRGCGVLMCALATLARQHFHTENG